MQELPAKKVNFCVGFGCSLSEQGETQKIGQQTTRLGMLTTSQTAPNDPKGKLGVQALLHHAYLLFVISVNDCQVSMRLGGWKLTAIGTHVR